MIGIVIAAIVALVLTVLAPRRPAPQPVRIEKRR